MANKSKGSAAEAKATAEKSAKAPFRATSNAQAAWNELYPALSRGKVLTMPDVVGAWQQVIKTKGLSTEGNSQSPEARASLYVTACLRLRLLLRAEGKGGHYVLGDRYAKPTRKTRKPQAEAPVEAAAAPTNA